MVDSNVIQKKEVFRVRNRGYYVFLVGLLVLSLFLFVSCGGKKGGGTPKPPSSPVKASPTATETTKAPETPLESPTASESPAVSPSPEESPSAPKESPKASKTTTTTEETLTPTKPLAGKVVIGVITTRKGSKAMSDEAIKAFKKEHPKVKFIHLQAGSTSDSQIKALKELMGKKVNAILMEPYDGLTGDKAAEIADKKGMPIFFMYVPPSPRKELRAVYVYYKDMLTADAATKEVEKLFKSGTRVLVFSDSPKVSRYAVAKSFAENIKKKGFKVVKIVPAEGFGLDPKKEVPKALKKYGKDIDLVVCFTDQSTKEAYKYIKSHNLKVKLVGHGRDPDLKKAIKSGKICKAMVASNYDDVPPTAISLIYKYLVEGKKVPREVSTKPAVFD